MHTRNDGSVLFLCVLLGMYIGYALCCKYYGIGNDDDNSIWRSLGAVADANVFLMRPRGTNYMINLRKLSVVTGKNVDIAVVTSNIKMPSNKGTIAIGKADTSTGVTQIKYSVDRKCVIMVQTDVGELYYQLEPDGEIATQ